MVGPGLTGPLGAGLPRGISPCPTSPRERAWTLLLTPQMIKHRDLFLTGGPAIWRQLLLVELQASGMTLGHSG